MGGNIDPVSQMLGRIEAQNKEIFLRLGEVETQMEMMMAMKNKGWGIVMTISLLSAVVGSKLAALLGGLGGMIK